nr:uncharacterized protein LOC107969419 [Pan troglodytes]
MPRGPSCPGRAQLSSVRGQSHGKPHVGRACWKHACGRPGSCESLGDDALSSRLRVRFPLWAHKVLGAVRASVMTRFHPTFMSASLWAHEAVSAVRASVMTCFRPALVSADDVLPFRLRVRFPLWAHEAVSAVRASVMTCFRPALVSADDVLPFRLRVRFPLWAHEAVSAVRASVMMCFRPALVSASFYGLMSFCFNSRHFFFFCL